MDWKSIETPVIKFCAPTGFVELQTPRTDTSIWRYGDSVLIVRVEYGSHVTQIKRGQDLSEYESQDKRSVDGQPGILHRFVLHGDEIDWDRALYNRKFVSELFIENVKGSANKLQVDIFGESEKSRLIADRIFESIQFTK